MIRVKNNESLASEMKNWRVMGIRNYLCIRIVGAEWWSCSSRRRNSSISTISSVYFQSFPCFGDHRDYRFGQALKNLSFDLSSLWRKISFLFLLRGGRIRRYHLKLDDLKNKNRASNKKTDRKREPIDWIITEKKY